jgi:hypothetical protein
MWKIMLLPGLELHPFTRDSFDNYCIIAEYVESTGYPKYSANLVFKQLKHSSLEISSIITRLYYSIQPHFSFSQLSAHTNTNTNVLG